MNDNAHPHNGDPDKSDPDSSHPEHDDPESQEDTQAPLEERARALTEPFMEFVRAQTTAGWLLLGAAVLALAIANSPWAQSYFEFLHLDLGWEFEEQRFSMTLQHWVNDGLMAWFFFLLGLELKRELLTGQLRELRRAASVLCAAVGGMLLPALIYVSFASAETRAGWAIPVATDTAFALMILVLLGRRVPTAARAFLVGFAIIDDLGAILVIAVTYTGGIDPALLLPTTVAVAGLALLNLTGVRTGVPYLIAGAILWWLFVQLGLHGTLAGVVVALVAPVRPSIARSAFLARALKSLRRFEEQQKQDTDGIFEQPEQQQLAEEVSRAAGEAVAPLTHWESRLERPISFLIMPLFAFMNAGVSLTPGAAGLPWNSDPGVSILAGMLLGKPIGIGLGIWIGSKLGIARLPDGLSWKHMAGLGMLSAIGFTMSLLIAGLAFDDQPQLLESAKRSVLATSLVAGILAYVWLRWTSEHAS